MQSFARKPNATLSASTKTAAFNRGHLGQSRKPTPMPHLPAFPRFNPDFDRIPAQRHSHTIIQAKLTAGSGGDIYEQDADRAADQVMRMPEPRRQPPCPCGGGCPRCKSKQPGQEGERLQTKRIQDGAAEHTATPPSIEEVLAASGRPLDVATRGFMESRFGYDFSRVRIHTDPNAAGSAESMGAQAYTTGHHVVFGAGEYHPETTDGRRLLAHELTHVIQQDARAPRGGVVQRRGKTPAKTTAAKGPKLDFRAAKNTPPCACLVFMHHNEPNARLTAQLMHEFCQYNLAIVAPETTERTINLPGKGKVDPNELFPRKIAEECWTDDKPCEDFLSRNAGATKASVVEEFAQRQFFLSIKKCSKGFALPVVALHNNTIGETARYRKAIHKTKAPLDVAPIKGKTFDDSLKAGEKSSAANTAPFADLQKWLLKNVPGVKKKKRPKGTKGTLTGGPFTPGKTNIFLWCASKDISRCQIGDPERPDNVVWVTNSADFEKLRGTKTNVALQTRVDPSGRSATDLSSLFVFLEGIVGTHFASIVTKLESEITVDASSIENAIDELEKLQKYGDLTPGDAFDQLLEILQRIIDVLLKLLVVAGALGMRAAKLSQLRYINIETPQSPYEKTTKPEDLRVQSFRDIKATLAALGIDCCSSTPAAGKTESAVQKVEKALLANKLLKG